ncbi:MAG: ABC transporter ATP-binding protein [Chloroflexota bacterium]
MMLHLRNLETSYGPIGALRGIDLDVHRGEIVCLIGSNGAGKSTALMTISGVLRPQTGDVIFEGESVAMMLPHQIVGRGICQVPEGRRIFPRLTVIENLEMGTFSKGGANMRKNLDRVFTLFPLLRDRMRQMGGTLSGGEQQMLAIGRALMAEPKLLLLDEPSLGLAPMMVSRIVETVREINREGVTILLVEQNAKAALTLSQRGYVLENGVIKLHGSSEELLHNDEVRRAYLGV